MSRARAHIAIAAAALALVAAAPASAQETSLSGETDNGFTVKLKVGEFGNATSFKVGGGEIACRRGGTLTNRAATYSPLDRSDPGTFSHKSKSSTRDGAITLTTKVRITGTATPDFLSWSGRYKATTKVIRGGEKIDTCKLDATWDAD
jgi:hypothetical protein